MSVRAFVAVDLPAEANRHLETWLAGARSVLSDDVRWVDSGATHLTLKFLGDVPEERVDELISRCQARAASVAPFEAELAGVGAFPNARRARVVWVGVGGGARDLARLARKLDAACSALGVPRERRPYRPHLTLGRLRRPQALAIERVEGPKGIAFRVEDIVFYSSRLSPRGAQHVPLARLPLGASTEHDSQDFAPEM